MQSTMAAAWPLDLSEQLATKIKQLKEQLAKLEKKLSVRERNSRTMQST